MSLRGELERRILELPGVTLRKSRFSKEPAFYVGKREFAHFHGDEAIDVRLTRKGISRRRQELKDDLRVHLRGSSDWLEVELEPDVERALELARAAADANRPHA